MNRTLGYSVLLLVLCCTVGVASCAPAPHYAYQIPEQTDDGWATASLDDVGIDTPHSLASVSKSVTSALVGIAIDRGYIQNVDEPVFSYSPNTRT